MLAPLGFWVRMGGCFFGEGAMVWPFGKKKQEQQVEPQGPDFVGALRVVAGRVLGFLGCSNVES